MALNNSRHARRRRQATQSGLTLVELLVSITLTGLIAVLLFGGLRFGVRAWDRGSNQIDRMAEVNAAQSLLRRTLAQAFPVAASAESEGPLGITGVEGQIRFVIVPPPHLADGRLYWLRIHDEADGEMRRLVLDRWPVEASNGPLADERELQVVSVLEGIETLQVAYFGAAKNVEESTWQQRWTDAATPPDLVRLRVTFPDNDDRVWPDLVIRPMIDGL